MPNSLTSSVRSWPSRFCSTSPGRARRRSRGPRARRSPARAWRAMARPRTWPPRSPKAAAIRRISPSSRPPDRHDLDYVGYPLRQGARLVERQTRKRPNSSRYWPPLMRMPRTRRRRQGARRRPPAWRSPAHRAGDHQQNQPVREPGRPASRRPSRGGTSMTRPPTQDDGHVDRGEPLDLASADARPFCASRTRAAIRLPKLLRAAS